MVPACSSQWRTRWQIDRCRRGRIPYVLYGGSHSLAARSCHCGSAGNALSIRLRGNPGDYAVSCRVAILSGGLATRLGPVTERIPKSLIDVAGKPFVVHQIELLKKNQLTELVLCVGHLGEMIQQQIGNGRSLGVEIEYIFDGAEPLGTGGALRHALPALGA